ncbi:MAG: glutamate formiminotransferase [Actinobacteria bacterium]|nr:glutamate formiminotransferase [Actinomycetota bacterium]
MLECVINVSEGRRDAVIHALRVAAGTPLLDVHTDADHNRTVLTLAAPGRAALMSSAQSIARAAVELIDLREHTGVHPFTGAIDVVPFVPLDDATMDDALAARDEFVAWARDDLALPCLAYGPDTRTLPEARRAVRDGEVEPHPTAGVCMVGARDVLVAYNLWLAEPDVALAKGIAAEVRSDAVRALGLDVGGHAQVSCNLIDPDRVGPDALYDAVASRAAVARAELVGLLPARVLAAIPTGRWRALDLGPSRTIEARRGGSAGLDGGSFGGGPGGS